MKPNKTYTILRQLADHTFPKAFRPLVRNWLVNHSELEEKESAILQLWDETPSESDQSTERSLQLTWRKIDTYNRQASRRLWKQRLLKYAAILLLPLITGVGAWWLTEKANQQAEMIECYVPKGEQDTIILPDGSKVQVNAGSLLIYPARFSSTKRQVFLSGEANFSVEADIKHPFIVRAGTLNVEVTGTKFNVESYPGSGQITTTLEHGSVKVYKEENKDESITLKPNEQLVYLSYENRFVTHTVMASDYAAWTTGELKFLNKSLQEILFALERKYDVRFLIDPNIQSTDQYTMKFKTHESIEDAMFVLSEVMNTIAYKKEGQTIRIYSVGKGVTP